MDKNLIYALLLTAIVMALFMSPWYQNRFGTDLPANDPVLTETFPDTPDTSPDVSRETTRTAPETISESVDEIAVLAKEGIVQIDPPSEPISVSLTNEKLKVDISTQGGVFTSVTMLQYNGRSDEELAQLVSPEQYWYGGLVIDGDVTVDFRDIVFEVAEATNDNLILTAELSGARSITRSYAFNDNNFLLHTDTILSGSWDEPRLSFSWHGPINDTEEPVRRLNIWPLSMLMRDDTYTYTKLSYLGQGSRVTTAAGNKPKDTRVYTDESQKVDAGKYKTAGTDVFDGDLNWYAVRSKYFMSAAIPQDQKLWQADASFVQLSPGKWYDFTISKRIVDGSTALDIYLGPISYDILKSSEHRLTEVMELSWRFVRPISIGFLWLLKKLRTFIPNWGLVIVAFSIFIKIVLYPLSHKSFQSMRKMSALQPQIAELREKHKNNPQKLQMATMELYRQEGVNPFGSCLPTLLQMPVFFALYPVVGRAFELRQALFIPGWIEDLSRPDPFYILPIAMGVSMFFQSRQSMQDPNQKAMLYIMPVMMVVLFANFSAGLTLYWFLFNVMSYIQQQVHKPS